MFHELSHYNISVVSEIDFEDNIVKFDWVTCFSLMLLQSSMCFTRSLAFFTHQFLWWVVWSDLLLIWWTLWWWKNFIWFITRPWLVSWVHYEERFRCSDCWCCYHLFLLLIKIPSFSLFFIRICCSCSLNEAFSVIVGFHTHIEDNRYDTFSRIQPRFIAKRTSSPVM